ncbi:hypothetical protein ACKS0A_06000 [Histoplasma ohiense]
MGVVGGCINTGWFTSAVAVSSRPTSGLDGSRIIAGVVLAVQVASAKSPQSSSSDCSDFDGAMLLPLLSSNFVHALSQ